FRIGGGADASKLGLRLLIDSKDVRRAAGRGGGAMRRAAFDVREFQGKKARLQIVDDATGGWGHTPVDPIVFSDPPIYGSVEEVRGYGSMAVSLLGEDGGGSLMAADLSGGGKPGSVEAEKVFDGLRSDGASATRPLDQHLIGAVGKAMTIGPGESASFD